jgi:pyridoxamine 5'-phosphate oxidase
MARLIERVVKKPLSEALLFGRWPRAAWYGSSSTAARFGWPDPLSIAGIRRDYSGDPLSETESDPDPFAQFTRWFEQVRDLEADPTAFATGHSTRDGRPSVRTGAAEGCGRSRLRLLTPTTTAARRTSSTTPAARRCCFYWPSLVRQVRIDGLVEKVDDAESDAYFATRPIESRWSVYASHQSEVIREPRRPGVARITWLARPTATPSRDRTWWGRLPRHPAEFEFWQGGPSRLHDRLRYQRDVSGVEARQAGSVAQASGIRPKA